MNANGAVDVPGPAVGLKPISDCPKLPSSRGDASIELWHYLLDGVAVNPTVFLEKGGLAIAGLHSSGGEENGALRGGELQLQA